MTEQSNGYFEHRTIAGDRWDLLAYRYYGDQHKQTVLIEANRNIFFEPLTVPPMVLEGGLTLRIPVLVIDQADEAGLPPWKRKNPEYVAQ